MPEVEITPMAMDPTERRVGISRSQYLGLFLDDGDFAVPMRRVQDTRLSGPDPVDFAFPRLQGILTGFAAWMSGMDQRIWRVVDIRWVFPTCWHASHYHAQQLGLNSEGTPAVESFRAVGEECRVFGGSAEIEAPGGIAIELTQYFYLFRVDRVVVKLYAAQGQEVLGAGLTPDDLEPLARRAEARIEALRTLAVDRG